MYREKTFTAYLLTISLLGMLFAFEISSTLFVGAELGFLGYFIGGGTWIEISDFVVTNTQGAPELGQLLSSALVTLVRPTVLLVVGTVIFFGILGFNLLGEGLRIRSYHQTAGGGTLRRLMGKRIGARIDGKYPLSVTDWVEAHTAEVVAILAVLFVAGGWYIWQNTHPEVADIQSESTLVVPGAQLWAAEKHDAQRALSSSM